MMSCITMTGVSQAGIEQIVLRYVNELAEPVVLLDCVVIMPS